MANKSPVTGEGIAPRFTLTQQDSGFWNVRDRGTLIRTEISLEDWEVIEAELKRQESQAREDALACRGELIQVDAVMLRNILRNAQDVKRYIYGFQTPINFDIIEAVESIEAESALLLGTSI